MRWRLPEENEIGAPGGGGCRKQTPSLSRSISLSGSAAVGSLSAAPQHADPESDEIMDFARAHKLLPRRQPKANAATDGEANVDTCWGPLTTAPEHET